MDDYFDEMDCRYRSDSILMRLLRSAMDNAYEKVQSKDGPIGCLHERSKFYEFAIIQIKGCYGLIQEETDSCISETSRENMLVDLIELQDLLQARLKEMKSSINEKDFELLERSKNEFKLRQVLALKDRELLRLRANIEIERAKRESFQDFILNFQANNSYEANEGEICELKNSIDQQVLNIKQKLEDERARKSASSAVDLDIEADVLDEYDDDFYEDGYFSDNQKSCFRPEQSIVIEQMSSDIDILEGTLKIAFERMQSFEMRPLEEQLKWMIERETASIVIKGFICDLKQKFEVSSRLPNEHILDLIEEMIRLRGELETLIIRNESMAKRAQNNDNSRRAPLRTSSEPLPEFDYMEDQVEEDISVENSNYVAKLIKNHESFIKKEQRKLHGHNKGLGRRRYSSAERENKSKFTERRILDVVEKLDNVTKWKDKIRSKIPVCPKEKKIKKGKLQNYFDKEFNEEISKLKEAKCVSELHALAVHEIYVILFKGLLEKVNFEFLSYDSESAIREEIYCTIYREAVKNFTVCYDIAVEEHQTYCLRNKLSEDICTIVMQEMVNDFKETMESRVTECLVTEEVYRIVYEEMLRYIRSAALSEISEHQDLPDIVECIVKDDVYTVLLREMVEAFKMEKEDYEFENFVREYVYQFVIVERAKEAFNQHHCSEDLVSTNDLKKKLNYTRELSSLSSCLKLVENPMLREDRDIREKIPQREELDECGRITLLSGDNNTLNLVSKKSEGSMDQLRISEELPKDRQHSLVIVNDSEKQNHHKNVDIKVLHENAQSLAKADSTQSVVFSILLSPLQGFQKLLVDFESMVEQKLHSTHLRLKTLKQKLTPIFQTTVLIREKNLLYKEAFVRRCHNLQLAENEVDLLGDQVEILLGLVNKVYLILDQYSPILSRYFEVSSLLKLIDEKVNAITAHSTNL